MRERVAFARERVRGRARPCPDGRRYSQPWQTSTQPREEP